MIGRIYLINNFNYSIFLIVFRYTNYSDTKLSFILGICVALNEIGINNPLGVSDKLFM